MRKDIGVKLPKSVNLFFDFELAKSQLATMHSYTSTCNPFTLACFEV